MSISTGNNGNTRRVLKYYLEDPDGIVQYKGKTFSEMTTVVLKLSSGANPTYEEEFFVIDGYERFGSNVSPWEDGDKNGSDRGHWAKGDNKFYYTKADYQLELVNGDQTDTHTVPYKNDITQYLEEPEYNPYGDGTFEGWYLDPEFTEAYDGDYTMPKGLVLYAKWNPVSYKVQFVDSEDVNTVYATQTVVRNGKVDAFIPEKPGYIFKGWYTDQECQNVFDYAAQITENRTIYAKWQQSTTTTYTVKHQTADGTLIEEEAPRSGKVGATVIAEAITPTGTYAGYVPDAISKTHTLKADSSENVIVFTYTKEGELSYKVHYKYKDTVIAEDGPFTSEAHTIKVNADLDKVLPLGYKIENDQTFQNVELTAGENIVVFNLVPAEYKITYELNGGTETTNPSTYKPIEIPENGLKLNNPVKDGYKFTGWELVVGEAIEGEHDPLNTVILPGSYGNLTFKANWERNEAALTIEYVDDSAEPKTLKDAYKDTVIIGDSYDVKDAIDASIEYDGHNYTWLKTDGEVEGTVEGDISITAVYTLDDNGNTIPDKNETLYSITYAAGEHGTCTETVVAEKQMPDLPVTSLPTVSEDEKSVMFDGAAIITAENGYKFGGMTVSWNPEEGGRFVEYEPKDGSAVTSIMAKNIGEELSNVTNITVTVNFVKDDAAVNQLSYTVEHIYDDTAEVFRAETVTQDVWVNDPQVLQVKDITVQAEDAEYTYDSNSYDLAVITDPADPSIVTGLTGSGTIENGGKIQVVYSKDENGDHVPDKYQTEVYFKVVNGSWNDETNTQKIQTVTLMTGGTWDDNGSYTVTGDIVPGVGDKANEGYKAGDWDRTPMDAVITKTTSVEERTFTYTYTEDQSVTKKLSYTVEHICRDTNELIGEIETVTEEVWINSADTTLDVKDITLRSKDGYTYDGNSMDLERSENTLLNGGKTIQNGETITVYYDVDVIGPDEIPDKYQVIVRYEAVNGTVSITEPVYVTIYKHTSSNEKELEYAEPGTEGAYGTLSKDQIADAAPIEGYDPSTEQWEANGEPAEKPTIETQITENTTYEVSFGKSGYVYDVVKRYLDANGNEVDAVFKSGTALYGQNILEASGVTVLQEELYKENLYELVKVEGADRLITNDPNANHVEIIYQQNAYVYDVVKRYLDANGNEVDAVFTGGTALYGQNILEASDVTVLQEELYKDNLYELVRVDGADRLITNDPNANRVEIIYQQKNYNYEVVKHYEGLNETAVESTKGTAPYGTGILEMSNVDVLQHETYKDHTYVLVKVDGADKLITNDEAQNRVDIYYALDEKGGTDPTDPTNPDGHPDKYQIIFRYVSADETMGTVSVTKEEVHTFTDEAGNYIDKYPISPNGATAQALEGFAFDYWVDTEGRDYTADMQNMKSQTYLEDTTFTAHFAEDKIGETDPENPDPNHPDNIPDYRQITFRYVSENPSYGTVNGAVVEVRTIVTVTEGENGYQVLETKSVNPFADVTVSANGRYSFERWSDGTTNFANTDEISAASFDADTTFTAYFDYNGGGSSGGGGGGGNGGGPSGSGGDSTGGPGVTVTIDNPEVPLAPAPGTGTGDVISINDGMVPMAPLPKTGQTTMRSTLLMAFSGILLAITGFSKKRKEEEN